MPGDLDLAWFPPGRGRRGVAFGRRLLRDAWPAPPHAPADQPRGRHASRTRTRSHEGGYRTPLFRRCGLCALFLWSIGRVARRSALGSLDSCPLFSLSPEPSGRKAGVVVSRGMAFGPGRPARIGEGGAFEASTELATVVPRCRPPSVSCEGERSARGVRRRHAGLAPVPSQRVRGSDHERESAACPLAALAAGCGWRLKEGGGSGAGSAAPRGISTEASAPVLRRGLVSPPFPPVCWILPSPKPWLVRIFRAAGQGTMRFSSGFTPANGPLPARDEEALLSSLCNVAGRGGGAPLQGLFRWMTLTFSGDSRPVGRAGGSFASCHGSRSRRGRVLRRRWPPVCGTIGAMTVVPIPRRQVKITDVELPPLLQERLERTTAYKTKIEEQ